ncbi:MAG: hypothetical protein ACRYGR_07165 [Janthinobacterium lividum]
MQLIHDKLKEYYESEMRRFIGNVCKQAAWYHLITSIDSPLKTFSTKLVESLSTDQLSAIAGEEDVSRQEREKLKQEISELEAGSKVFE